MELPFDPASRQAESLRRWYKALGGIMGFRGWAESVGLSLLGAEFLRLLIIERWDACTVAKDKKAQFHGVNYLKALREFVDFWKTHDESIFPLSPPLSFPLNGDDCDAATALYDSLPGPTAANSKEPKANFLELMNDHIGAYGVLWLFYLGVKRVPMNDIADELPVSGFAKGLAEFRDFCNSHNRDDVFARQGVSLIDVYKHAPNWYYNLLNSPEQPYQVTFGDQQFQIIVKPKVVLLFDRHGVPRSAIPFFLFHFVDRLDADEFEFVYGPGRPLQGAFSHSVRAVLEGLRKLPPDTFLRP